MAIPNDCAVKEEEDVGALIYRESQLRKAAAAAAAAAAKSKMMIARKGGVCQRHGAYRSVQNDST